MVGTGDLSRRSRHDRARARAWRLRYSRSHTAATWPRTRPGSTGPGSACACRGGSPPLATECASAAERALNKQPRRALRASRRACGLGVRKRRPDPRGRADRANSSWFKRRKKKKKKKKKGGRPGGTPDRLKSWGGGTRNPQPFEPQPNALPIELLPSVLTHPFYGIRVARCSRSHVPELRRATWWKARGLSRAAGRTSAQRERAAVDLRFRRRQPE